jgi:hypothetical protein
LQFDTEFFLSMTLYQGWKITNQPMTLFVLVTSKTFTPRRGQEAEQLKAALQHRQYLQSLFYHQVLEQSL